ncbi:MAG: peptidase modulator of gyrase [Clostridia bacterium]|jgi:PmbA protein|nr:peptidase modulator of gyrase [Clostridia bacterium]
MEKLFDKVLQCSDGGDLFKKEEQTSSVVMLQGVVQKIQGKKAVDLALRIVKDNNMGSAVSTSVEDDTIIERALISCKYQKQEPVQFTEKTPSIVQCFDKKVSDMSVEELAAEGQRVLDIFKKHEPGIIPDIYISNAIRNIHVINSKGFDNSYDKTEYSISLSTKTAKGFTEIHDMLEASNYQQFSEEDIARIITKHKISQNRIGVDTGKMPVIFGGKAMGSLMMRFLAGIKASSVFKGISPLEGKLAEQVFSKEITIRDNGMLTFGIGSCPFDDEGVATANTLLVEKGELKGYLAGISDAVKLQVSPTGNSFKRTLFTQDIEDAPALDSTNLLIEGNNIPDEKLIKDIKYGIYVDSVMGAHTGNIIAGEYSLNIGCGYLIQDGEFTGKVMNAMVAGNIYEDFKKIAAIGTRNEVMRTIFYSMGYSPMILFKDLSIVGK